MIPKDNYRTAKGGTPHKAKTLRTSLISKGASERVVLREIHKTTRSTVKIGSCLV